MHRISAIIALLASALVTSACAAMPPPSLPPQPLLMGDSGVIVHVVNDSSESIQVFGLDGADALDLGACNVLRWVIPEGRTIVDVRTPSRRLTVPVDVDNDSDEDIRVYIDALGVIGQPTRIKPGSIEAACARGRDHGAARQPTPGP